MGVLLALTFSLSTFADVPRNNVRGSLNITSSVSYIDGSPLSINIDDVSIPFGTTKLFDVYYRPGNGQTFYSDSTLLHGNFNLVVTEPCSLYLCVNNDSDSVISYDNVSSELSTYRDTSNDIYTEYIVPDSHIALGIQSTNGSHVLNPDANAYSGEQFSVVYQAFSNVPAGTYNLDFVYQRTSSAPNYYCYFILGIYAVGLSPVDKFESGQITFDQALSSIITDMQSKLDEITSADAIDYNQAQFVVSYAEYEIKRIEQISDVRYNSVVSNFNDVGEQIVDDYISSGQVSPYDYIDSLQQSFTDALTQANTPEQGSFLSSCFQNILAKLQLAFDMQYKQELDDTITDSQLEVDKDKQDNLLAKYFEEDELREKFSQAEFEALSNWRLWLDDIGDYTAYRSIFNYLFTEFGVISTIVQIPFVFMIVALLLGTSINRSKGDNHSRREVEKNSEIRSVDE